MAVMTTLVLPSILRTFQSICHAVEDACEHFILLLADRSAAQFSSEEDSKWARKFTSAISVTRSQTAT